MNVLVDEMQTQCVYIYWSLLYSWMVLAPCLPGPLLINGTERKSKHRPETVKGSRDKAIALSENWCKNKGPSEFGLFTLGSVSITCSCMWVIK